MLIEIGYRTFETALSVGNMVGDMQLCCHKCSAAVAGVSLPHCKCE